MASTYLQRSTGTPTSQTKFTVSVWVKRSGLNPSGNNMDIFCIYSDSSNRMHIRFQEDDIDVINYGGSTQARLTTDRKFRDTNAWYHIVWRVDTTLATADDRVRLYVNGVQETSFSTRTNPSQNFNFGTNWSTTRIGTDNSTSYFDGSMSHFHYSDGYSYSPDTFGSTDSTTGEWKINTSPTFTLGNNGFTVLKDGNTITDQSSNSNDFTVANGTLTKTEDCPSNVFCTMNVLDNQIANSTFSQGNNTIQTNNSNYTWNTGTLGMTSGKFYWEIKYSANSNTSYYNLYGIADRPTDGSTDVLGRQTDCSNYAYYSDTGQKYEKNVLSAYGDTWTVGDIIGVAVDLDNNKLYFSKNGVWQNSGDPTSGATGTGAISIDAISSTTTGVYFPASGDYGSTQDATNQHNFGNGYFGTTAVASAGTNASGIGIFEYDVPTGYTALSTKGLNE